MIEQIVPASENYLFLSYINPSLLGKRQQVSPSYGSAFQPVHKLKAIQCENKIKLEEDQLSLGKESIGLSEGTVNSKSNQREEVQLSPKLLKLRKNKESANKCRNKKKVLMKYYDEEIFGIRKENEDLALKAQIYKESAEKINQKTEHIKQRVNLANIENVQLKGQLLILQEKYRQTQSFVMSLIFPGGINNDIKLQ